MAGTLTISTLSDGTNSTSATNCIQGSAKAWVNWNGVTTASIRASYNVSSVTRNGTGDYTINFTNALTDSNYVVTCGWNGYNTTDNGRTLVIQGTSSGASDTLKTSSQVRMAFGAAYAVQAQDGYDLNVAIFR